MKNIYKFVTLLGIVLISACSTSPSRYENIVKTYGVYELKQESEKQDRKKIETLRFTDEKIFITVVVSTFSGKELKRAEHQSVYSVKESGAFAKVRYSIKEDSIIYDLAIPLDSDGNLKGYIFNNSKK